MYETLELIPCVLLTYVLELQDGKYYVGITSSLNTRLGAHWSGQGSKWTRLHKPVKIMNVILGDKERETTLLMMKGYGWQNVRGSSWCRVDLKSPPPALSGVISK